MNTIVKVDIKHSILAKTKKKKLVYTKQDAMDYLMKNVFIFKKKKITTTETLK
jgi:hypothetical protein